MGLDQCLYKTHKNMTEEIIRKFYIKFCRREITTNQFEKVVENLEYWNKNYELEQIVYETWKKRKDRDNDLDKFNRRFVLLKSEDIKFIIKETENKKIKISMKKALKESKDNNIFFYSSW